MSWANWIILIEGIALVLAIGWIVFREIVHARTLALVDLAIDDQQSEIDLRHIRQNGEVR